MASPYDEFRAAPAGGDPYAEFQKPAAPPAEKPGFFSQYASTVGNDLNPVNIYNAIRHPIDTMKATMRPPGPDNMPMAELLGHATAGLIGHGVAKVVPKIPEIVKAAPDKIMSSVPQGFSPIPHIGEGIRAASPDVISGGMKAGLGFGLAEAAPGPLKWPARAGLMYPGLKQVGQGLKAGGKAMRGETAVAEVPTAQESKFTPPSVFGDPQGFSKLPTQVQDAIIRGPQKSTPTTKSVPLSPRDPSHYGLDAPITAPAKPTIQVPATGAAEVVERVEHPPFAPDRPFSPSKAARQQTRQVVPETDQAAKIERLKQSFPWETEAQLMMRLKPGALDAARKLQQSLGAQ